MTRPRLADIRPRRSDLVLLGCGVTAALGLAPFGLWPLTVLALALAFGVWSAAGSGRAAARSGWWFGLGWFGLGLCWIVQPFLVDPSRHGWMAPFGLVFMAGGMALFWALAGWLGHRVAAPAARPLALAVTLTGAEYLRSVVLTGFPWNLVGHVWIGTGVDQVAAVTGAHGLTLLTCAAAALPALAAHRGSAVQAALAMALTGLFWAAGAALTRNLPPIDAEPGAPVVRLVQPNAPQDEKWQPGRAQDFFRRQLAFSAAGPVPDLIVWPETAVPVFLEYPGTVLEEMAEAARGAPVAFGVQRYREPRFYNSIAVLTRGGLVAAIYDKFHLVPFGEYMPFGDLLGRLGIHGLAATEGGGFSAGPGVQVIDLPGIGPALPMICYEGIFPHLIGRYDRRPRLMLLVTNDAWFGEALMPYQHLAQARLRAIEQGLPMVRVANTGISAMIDPRGHLSGTIPLGEAGWQDAALPPALPPTLYAGWGDWPMIGLLAALLAGFATYPRSRTRGSH